MRISGITIPENKRLEFGLTSVYGVGRARAVAILNELKISPSVRPAEVSTEQEKVIREKIESLTIEGELRRETASHIKRLKDIKSYRGSRHAKRLPARGQRTKTNARTLKGVRKTMGSGRRKESKT